MDIGLRALDVVVQIVPERVDQVDGVVSSTGVGVAREQHEGNVANVVAHGSIGVLQLQRRFPVAEEDLRGCVTGSAAFFELLHKHFSNDHIVVILKHCAEDYCDSVLFRFISNTAKIDPLNALCNVLLI